MSTLAALVALLPAALVVLDLRTRTRREGPPSTAPVVPWPDSHEWGPYCGGAVWSWGGIDGQCALGWNHPGKCKP